MKKRLAILLFMFVPIAGAQVSYTITDLGPLSPMAINMWGQVAGSLNGHAYMWMRFGGLKNLGILPGGTFASATNINDFGQVVGYGDVPPDPLCIVYRAQTVAFRWTWAGGIQSLGTLGNHFYPPCVYGSYASDINAQGEVAGTNGWPSTTYIDPILWTAAAGMTYIPTEFYQSKANAINNLGQVVGAGGGYDGAFVWPPEFPPGPVDPGAVAALWYNGATIDLGTLSSDGRSCSEAADINDLGQVVGWSSMNSDGCYFNGGTLLSHAFLWTEGAGMQDLGTLPGATTSQAYKINFFGQVIGSSDGNPFIWTQKTRMRGLNALISSSSGWVLYTATGINIWGQIVGSGTRNGQPRGYLLTPRTLFGF